MEFDDKEKKILDAAERFDETGQSKRIFYAILKYGCFAVVMLLVFHVIFGNLLETDHFAFAVTIVALMVYDLKGEGDIDVSGDQKVASCTAEIKVYFMRLIIVFILPLVVFLLPRILKKWQLNEYLVLLFSVVLYSFISAALFEAYIPRGLISCKEEVEVCQSMFEELQRFSWRRVWAMFGVMMTILGPVYLVAIGIYRFSKTKS